MCGMTPSLETSWVEFEREDVLKAVCLPGLLRYVLGRSGGVASLSSLVLPLTFFFHRFIHVLTFSSFFPFHLRSAERPRLVSMLVLDFTTTLVSIFFVSAGSTHPFICSGCNQPLFLCLTTNFDVTGGGSVSSSVSGYLLPIRHYMIGVKLSKRPGR